MKSRILQETTDFLRLFRHAAGKSLAPPQYLYWTCLALLSAAVANRVGVQKLRRRFPPNLYVFLLGPSGVGKGEAINETLSLLSRQAQIRWYDGQLTAASLCDYVGRRIMDVDEERVAPEPEQVADWEARSKLLLITPELAEAIATGEQAGRFVHQLTEWYTCHNRIRKEHTRGAGLREIWHPTITWVAGTTVEWLRKSVSLVDIMGGFFARVIPVEAFYVRSTDPDPHYPPDSDEVRKVLRARVVEMSYMLEGDLVLTEEAVRTRLVWFANRPEPDDPHVRPFWQRADDAVLKIATLLAISEVPPDQVDYRIQGRHMADAQRVVGQIGATLPSIYASAIAASDSGAVEAVRAALRRLGVGVRIGHSQLLRRLSGRAVDRRVFADAISMLRETGEITVDVENTGGKERRFYALVRSRAPSVVLPGGVALTPAKGSENGNGVAHAARAARGKLTAKEAEYEAQRAWEEAEEMEGDVDVQGQEEREDE